MTGGDKLPGELSPPTNTRSDIGDAAPEPDERLGAKIKNTETLKGRAARTREFFVDKGEDLAKDSTSLAMQVRNIIAARDPGAAICVADTHSLTYQSTPLEQPDPADAAGSIMDTGIFLADIIVMIYRKVRDRDR